MIRYIIFDFDGTLANSQAVFISVYNQIAIKNNYRRIQPENLDLLRIMPLKERCKYLKVPLYKIPFLAADFLKGYKKALPELTLFAGIDRLLEALNEKGYHTAIISSNSKINIAGFLKNNNINSISGIYCSTSLFGKDKLLSGFLKKYSLKPGEVLYVGDELRDIVACQKVGIKVVWVEWGYELKQSIISSKPDYIASRPEDILSFLR